MSRFVRFEATKTKLTGSGFEVTSIDAQEIDITTGATSTTYGLVTITGTGTAFTTELANGDVVQLCTDSTLYDVYSSSKVLPASKMKHSAQFEVVLEELVVIGRASNTSMTLKPYTSYDEEFDAVVDRIHESYVVGVEKTAGVYSAVSFTTVYKKTLVNSVTNDYVVNIDDIKYFQINSSSAQNMDVLINSGNSASTTMTVHNCFDYLNYILQPHTVIEPNRILFAYSNPDLIATATEIYANYKYEYRDRRKKEVDALSKAGEKALEGRGSTKEYKRQR
jgi:hypothetical protein